MNLAKSRTKRKALFGGVVDDLSSGVSRIVRDSVRATCGSFERELTVPASKVAVTKAKLRASGMMIVGTSEPNGSSRKIWFVPRGLSTL